VEVWEVCVRPKEAENVVVKREGFMWSLKVVMEGERSEVIRRNASEWKKLARDAVCEGGSFDKNIDDLLLHL
jgi:hypothetical protein